MKYLDIRLRQPEWMMHPMQVFAKRSDAVEYEELQAWNLIGSQLNVEYELFYVEGDRQPYEAKLDSVDSIRWYDLTPIDDGAFYVYVCQQRREEDVVWQEAFAALDLLVVPPVVYDDSGEFSMTVVGEGEEFQTLLEGLPEDIDVTVETVGEYDRRHVPVAGDLTDRQLAAVSTAVEVGYYEVPREGSVEEVAARLDCAASTASKLLQRAEASVLSRVVDYHGR
ncbi:bacterio-opsin activator [Halapricum sp. CBA1109]|uniref:helix-turn-helix domain-containing protein n=1 Tax=Halapricum sp. CBA1109 TaxID=2668068 RepID=UPI0013B939B7|nr:bacterio-opsin activator [Halapricum sp. CBA1109]